MDIDYRENERKALLAKQAAAWSISLSEPGRELVASGDCPECRHRTRYTVRSEISTAGAAVGGSVPVERRTTRKIPCACRGNHGSHPAGLAGCGRWWLVDVVRSDDDSGWHLEPAQDDRMLAAAEALNDAAATQLTEVRSAVEKWLPGLAALYGLFGLAAVVSGRGNGAKLPVGERWVVGAFALAGLGATVLSITCGYRAAYGWPRTVKVMTNEQLQTWYEERNSRAGKAVGLFRTALVYALAALIALLVAAGTLWVWPAP